MSRTLIVYWTLALVAADVLAVAVGTFLAYELRFESGILPYEEFHAVQNYFGYLATVMIAEPIVLAANGLYRPRRSISWLDQIYGIFTSTSVASAIAIVASAVMWHDVSSSRLMVGLSWLSSVILVTLGRLVVHGIQSSVRRRGIGTERLVIVGTGEPAHLVLE